MAKHICILVSPTGEEFYETYGPMTKLRDKATRFDDASKATSAANHRYGRHQDAFWNSERASRDKAAMEYRDWTVRTEAVSDGDQRRNGYSLCDYASGNSTDKLYARIDDADRLSWHAAEEGCHLWALRDDAVAFAHTLPKTAGRNYAVSTY